MKLKTFQREDLARMALHDGGILSWDTGLGKTWATFLWPLLKVGYYDDGQHLHPRRPVLIVAPGDLHRQIMDEGMQRFRIQVLPLDSQAKFLELAEPHGYRALPAGFYITSYTQLGGNGVAHPPNLEKCTVGKLAAWLDAVGATVRPPTTDLGEIRPEDILDIWNSPDGGRISRLRPDLLNAIKAMTGPAKAAMLRQVMNGKMPDELTSMFGKAWEAYHHAVWDAGRLYAAGVGDRGSTGVRCICQPSLADLTANVWACVVVDEGVRLKGDDTHISQGVRTLNPPYRLVLTATPIKNRLPDFFWLAHWATGGMPEAHARFPYNGNTKDKAEFAKTFLVSEENLTKAAKAALEKKQSRRFVKLTAEVCNVHRLWKVMGPITLRRRKQDCGEDIVPKRRHVVRVPMGKEQRSVYAYHMNAKYLDVNGAPAIGAQLQALRVAAAAPHSMLLQRVETDTPNLPHRSSLPYTPKMAAAMQLVAQFLEAGDQTVVFSAFQDPLDYLGTLLGAAAVPYVKLDGRVSQRQRGELAAQFKLGPAGGVPVMLAGVECMAEGHSFPLCPNVILISYSWAMDKFEQAINRVHRMNSPRPVDVWSVISQGTIDRKLEASIAEKSDSAELVLDGRLADKAIKEESLAELLEIARREFDAGAEVLDESTLAGEWQSLQLRLQTAMQNWSRVANVPEAARMLNPPKPQPAVGYLAARPWLRRFYK